MSFTIIEYYGPQNNSRCGYCKQTKTCHSHGMHAYKMLPKDYQDLIDRGWRRSGHYCYKPDNKITCCPCYTIKCDSNEFKLSKSHKKILKRMNKFLTDGVKEKETESSAERSSPVYNLPDGNASDEDVSVKEDPEIPNKPIHDINVAEIARQKEVGVEKELLLPHKDEKPESLPATVGSQREAKRSEGSDTSKPPCKKAKQMRLERKQMKLAAKGLSTDSDSIKKESSKNNNQGKSLRQFIEDVSAGARHKLKVILVQSNKGVTIEVLNLYRKYQVAVHKDPPQKINRAQFERFLVKSPLKLKLVEVNSDEFKETLSKTFGLYTKYQVTIHNDHPENVDDYLCFLQKSPLKNTKSPEGPSVGFGSFHQQYWLDDRLIAVGVIDILPYCISSVYFFYDPEFSFLSLGTYGSLREIHLTQQLSEKCPDLKYYYMGFYIHSCPKMRYKGRLVPSYLLCPEVYTWHLLTDDTRRNLDECKYQRLNPDRNAKDPNEFNESDIDSVLLLINGRTYITYREYIQIIGGDDTRDAILEYGRLAGKECAHRILYLMNS